MIQIGSIPAGVFVQMMLYLVLGRNVFAKNSRFQVYLKRFDTVLSAFASLIVIYPLYKVLYEFVPKHYRAVVVVVLPFWRLAAKQIMVRATREVEDFMPQIVAFYIDFYSTLFISVCMSTSGSMYLSALFITADVAQSLLEIREARANAATLLQLAQDRQASQIYLSHKNSHDSHTSESVDLLQLILSVTRDPGHFHVLISLSSSSGFETNKDLRLLPVVQGLVMIDVLNLLQYTSSCVKASAP
ncbi:hypothetical protein PHYPSEUDO_009787 [Phytophthora pseudosyringae]|uniref:Uncharacterized protein n=1 Tax=Phytophthora pseudosyringae TaxID=221518 RepID=A0A8T1VBF6_9STRA|nr:hypothetical protein PHYPSEUDO_009787 [Phytophthora pseudosyringae]